MQRAAQRPKRKLYERLHMDKFNFWTVVIFLLLIFTTIFIIYPFGKLFLQSFSTEEQVFTFENYLRFFTKRYYRNALVNSLKVLRMHHGAGRGHRRAAGLYRHPLQALRQAADQHHDRAFHAFAALHRRLFVDHAAWPQRHHHAAAGVHRHRVWLHLRLWRHTAGLYAQTVSPWCTCTYPARSAP